MRASGISSGFPGLSQSLGQVAHVLLTRSPLGLPEYCYSMDPVRLACVKHAASVRPEPGSNSPSRAGIGSPRGDFRYQTRTQNRQLLTSLSVSALTLLQRVNLDRSRDRPHWRNRGRLLPTSIRPLFRCQGAPLPCGGAAGTRSLGRLVPLVPSLAGQHKAEGFRGGAPRYRPGPEPSTREGP